MVAKFQVQTQEEATSRLRRPGKEFSLAGGPAFGLFRPSAKGPRPTRTGKATCSTVRFRDAVTNTPRRLTNCPGTGKLAHRFDRCALTAGGKGERQLEVGGSSEASADIPEAERTDLGAEEEGEESEICPLAGGVNGQMAFGWQRAAAGGGWEAPGRSQFRLDSGCWQDAAGPSSLT